MPAEKEIAPEWTTLNVRLQTANKVRDLAHKRKKERQPNASTRDAADELIRLGLDTLRASRTHNTITP